MTRLYLGTASVLSGETTVTVTAGDPLNAANCPPDASVILGALPGHVASRLSTTQFALAQPYAGADGSVALTIDPLTPEATSLVNLTVLAARVQAQLNVLDANSQGLYYTLLGVTGAADPGPGRIAFNNADPVAITSIYVDPIDANGRPVGGLIEQWEAGTVLIIRSLTTTAYVALSVTQAVALSGGYYPGLVAHVDHDGTIAPDEAVSISWVPGGVGLEFDHAVDDLASRAAYDASAAGTRVLVADAGAGRAAIYVKRAAAGIWSAPAYIDGPQGPQGNMPTLAWLPAVTAAPGAPAAVDVTPVAGGYEVELTLPQGLPGGDGIDGKFSGAEVIKTAGYTAVAGDSGKTIILNKATADTLSFDPAASLGATWMIMVKNIGAGTWTLDPNAAETIDGAASVTLAQNESVIVSCNGAGLRTLFRGSAAAAASKDSRKIDNLGLQFSVAGSALTCAVKQADGSTNPSVAQPVTVAMRSATAGSGAFVDRTITSALSLTISSGSTLGHQSAIPSVLYWYLIDNAGTLELAVSFSYFGQSGIVSTTAEGGAGGADNGAVMYSATSRANVAYVLIGRTIDTQTTAGTWASAPSQVHVGRIEKQVVAFNVNKGGIDQTGITASVDTKMTVDTEVYDLGGYYDAPNSRWYPPPGVVSLSVTARFTAGVVDGGLAVIQVWKNGSMFKQAALMHESSTLPVAPSSAFSFFSTGSDYYEIYVFASGTGSKTISGSAAHTDVAGFIL